MEKYVVWYWLWLKNYIKNKMYWLQLIGMALALFIVASFQIPNGDNVTVGVCCSGGEYSRQLTEWLLGEESVFIFQEYHTTDQLYDDVLSGKIECGFVFDEELDVKIKEGNLKKSITYVGSSFSTKGAAVQETVYAGLLRIYSDEILLQSETDIYGDSNEERMQRILAKSHEYLDSDAVFQLNMDTVSFVENKSMNAKASAFVQTDPIRGMIGLFVFFTMFLAYGTKYNDNYRKVNKAMRSKERFLYSCMNMLAAGTIPMFASLLGIICFVDNICIGTESMRMVLLVAVSSVWITVFGCILKTAASFAGTIIPMLLVNLLVCPVFINLEMYVPAIRYLQMCFPLGIYLVK